MSDAGKKSYGTILKSSATVGGSAAVTSAFGLVRAKVMAELLDPSGFGVMGTYLQIAELARTLAGLGINNSGVRQIAEAVGSGDNHKIARTVITLRRVALYSGLVGAVLLVLLCRPVSGFSFAGDYSHATSIALLALYALCMDISAGQLALVQGMRRIGDIARINVLGALSGTVFSILIVYFWNVKGLAPSLVCVAATSILTSWWYARKIKVERLRVTISEIWNEASELVKLGFVFMVSGFAMFGAQLLVRAIINRKLGLDAGGYYQAAWNIGGLYIAFIIQAMGTDFYPRLTGVANRHDECNRLVNEQAEVGLLMAAPGLLGTLTFAPLVISIFASHKLGPGAEVLRWLCVGMLMRVVSWPMGFIILAKGEKKIFFWFEVLSWVAYIALFWTGVALFGLVGSGIAFFALYFVNSFVLYAVVRRLTGFRWTSANRQLWFLFGPMIAVVFLATYFLKGTPALLVGAAVTLAAAVYSLRTLAKLIATDRLPRPLLKLMKILKLIPSNLNPNEQHENSSNRAGLCGPATVVSVRQERSDSAGIGH